MVKLKLKPQAPPFTIQIETSEFCNLRCSFCGTRGMKVQPTNLMTVQTAQRIADEIARVGWMSKIAFGMHGEPTFNPMFLTIVREIRKRLPRTTMHVFTNGYGIMHSADPADYIMQMAEAGINNVILDHYSPTGDAAKVVAMFDDVVELKAGIPLFSTGLGFRVLSVPPIDLDNKNKSTRRLANHCGAAAPLDKTFNNKRCTMPFRELSIRWDGNVALCCDDFRGEYPIANVNDMPIDELWNHERFQAARIMLYNYSRDFKPCDGCTNISSRVGFLPDPQGQEMLPDIMTPDGKEARKIVNKVSKVEKPLAEIVKRPWEK